MKPYLRLIANNDLERFPRSWREPFARGRVEARKAEADFQARQGNSREADRQFIAAARIRP